MAMESLQIGSNITEDDNTTSIYVINPFNTSAFHMI